MTAEEFVAGSANARLGKQGLEAARAREFTEGILAAAQEVLRDHGSAIAGGVDGNNLGRGGFLLEPVDAGVADVVGGSEAVHGEAEVRIHGVGRGRVCDGGCLQYIHVVTANAIREQWHSGLVELPTETDGGLVSSEVFFGHAVEVMADVQLILAEHALLFGSDVGSVTGDALTTEGGRTGEDDAGSLLGVRREDLLDRFGPKEAAREHVIGVVETALRVNGPLPRDFAGVRELGDDFAESLRIDGGVISHNGCVMRIG